MNDKTFLTLSIITICLFIGSLILVIKRRRFNFWIHFIITILFTVSIIIVNIILHNKSIFNYFQNDILLSILLPYFLLLLLVARQKLITSLTFILNTSLSIFVVNLLRLLALRYIHVNPLLIDSFSFILYPIIWIYVQYFYIYLQNEIEESIPRINLMLFIYVALTFTELIVYDILAELTTQPILRSEIFNAAILSVYFVSFSTFNLIFKGYKNKLLEISHEEIFHKEAHHIEEKLVTYQESKNELRVIKHDLKHILITLSQLISNNKLDEANNIIQEYTSMINETVDTKKYSDNTIIDSILSYYVTFCEKNDIKFNIQFDSFENILNISDLDFSVFISNCLENAVNATMKLNKDREINLSLINNKSRIILQIKNTYNGKIKLDNNNSPISKHKDHGIGTTSIKWFVEKYNWDLNYDINKTHFTISILFTNNQK